MIGFVKQHNNKIKMENNNINNTTSTQEQCTIIKPAIKHSLIFLTGFLIAFPVGLVISFLIWLIFQNILIIFFLFFLIFGIMIFIYGFFTAMQLNNIEYKFYSNRVEYYDGFLVKNRKTINYEKISNVSQSRGIIERIWGLGTIYIDTPGSSNLGHELAMSYLENSDQVYDWICQTTQKK